MNNICDKARRKAMQSRDKSIILQIKKLEYEHQKKLDVLIEKAAQTMNPQLRAKWKEAERELKDFSQKMILKSYN